MESSEHQNATETPDADASRRRHRRNWWYLLLLLPLIGLLYPPWYARMNPMLGGVPFFIWYQFAWVLGGVATTVTVSRLTD